MRVLESLASVFIRTFGITEPSETTRRRASWFIVLLTLAALAVAALVGSLFYRVLRG